MKTPNFPTKNALKFRWGGISSVSDYSAFGVQLENRVFEGQGFRYGFQNQEWDDEVKGEGNSVNFEYRMHDPRLGRWFCLDRMAYKYPQYSPYHFTANNTLWFYEIDGAVFDFGTMSKEEKEQYDQTIRELKSSKIFSYYYSVLENSSTVYHIYYKNPNVKTGGQFNPNTNTVSFSAFSHYVIAQELFHAYQFDQDFYMEPVPFSDSEEGINAHSNIETEGDIMTLYIMLESGLPHTADGFEWYGELMNRYGDGFELPSEDDVKSVEYNQLFQNAVSKRIDFYLNRMKVLNTNAYQGYTVKKSDAPPKAIISVFSGAKSLEILDTKLENQVQIGPRLENGNF